MLAVNARLLAFMAHDRVTLAGTMISIGVLYAMLALHGVRRAMHWAWKAIAVSGAVGFASFFLAFGFGYFDPLHALVTVALLPFFLFGLRGARAAWASSRRRTCATTRAGGSGCGGNCCSSRSASG